VVGSLRLLCRYKRFLYFLGFFSEPRKKNIFSLAIHFFNSLVPIAQQAEQVAVLGRLSLTIVFVSVQNSIKTIKTISACSESTVTGPQKNIRLVTQSLF
jgi:hypothetical protein